MALQHFTKIRSFFTFLARTFSSKKDTSSCSFWSYFGGKKEEKEKPPLSQCKKAAGPRLDPDLSRYGGQAYRTCGRGAYIVQKDAIPPCTIPQTDEDKMLVTMESDLSNKENICDPMPPFESVEQRMIDLTDRKLHPYYRRYMALPKKDFAGGDIPQVPFHPYKCHVGDVKAEQVPDLLKLNKQLLEKKNIFADFKRVELPRQMLARILEIEKNRKPTLEKKEKK